MKNVSSPEPKIKKWSVIDYPIAEQDEFLDELWGRAEYPDVSNWYWRQVCRPVKAAVVKPTPVEVVQLKEPPRPVRQPEPPDPEIICDPSRRYVYNNAPNRYPGILGYEISHGVHVGFLELLVQSIIYGHATPKEALNRASNYVARGSAKKTITEELQKLNCKVNWKS